MLMADGYCYIGKPTSTPMLRTILVYPHAYVASDRFHNPDGTVADGREARLGESWLHGPVVLSWDDVLAAKQDPADRTMRADYTDRDASI